MKLQFQDLWRWEGTIGRGPYAFIGLLAFALKHNLDRFVSTFVFDREWGLFNYWISPFGSATIESLTDEHGRFIAAMLALALPFIWIGVALTLRRLRSIGWPTWLVIFFFAPFLNLVFFLLLCILPAASAAEPTEGPRLSWLDRFLPDNPVGTAAMALLLTNLISIPFIWLSTMVLEDYGWGVFVGMPFFQGFASVMIYGYRAPRPFLGCFMVSSISMLLTTVLMLAVALEGLICLLMFLPLAAPLVWLGGSVGYLIQRRRRVANAAQVFPLLLLGMPGVLWVEHHQLPDPPEFAASTAVEINAQPETVWNHVVSFAELPEPEDWVFQVGISYPIRAEISGSGPGAERHCVFSTGSFVEPIEVWDEPRLLKFFGDLQPSTDGGVDALRRDPPRTLGRVSRLERRTVPASAAGRRPYPPRWHNLVPAQPLACFLLEALVRRVDPPDSFAGLAAHQA